MISVQMMLSIALTFAVPVSGQEKRLTFEVASIKPANPARRGGGIKPKPAGQGYDAQGATVRLMIRLMYRMPMQHVMGGPEGPVFALMVDKAGSKMKLNQDPQDFEVPITGSGRGAFNGKRVPMEYLCYWLGQALRDDSRRVIDKTGLTGNYDFTLSFLPELPPGFDKANLPPEFLDRPSLFDALREQLGLRLEAQKGPVEYYVIDHAEKPAVN